MKKNMGKTDRLLRLLMVIAFVIFIVSGLAHYPQVYFLEVLIGILLITATVGFCPLFALFGINSLETNEE
ncbi:MAG: DUF2892 domain-containing protein [Bacteroidetes bacterium]|jgi:cytochrome b subunit of formate dehydrogenase|nr:DUF2892 domain-containing protein [Bacteroidota bacterium]